MPLLKEPQSPSSTEHPSTTNAKVASLFQSLRKNPTYYFENLLKVENKAGQLVPFKPNSQQQAIINLVTVMRELEIPIRIVCLKARQIGMSTLCAGLLFHATSLWPHRHSKVVAHDTDTTELLYEKSKLFYQKLPDEPLLKPPTEKYTRKGLVFADPLRSRITVSTAGSGNVGTGQTIQNFHGSETAKWENPGTIATSFMQSIPPPSVNPNTMIILESTAEGYGDYFHDLYLNAKKDKEQLLIDIRKTWHDRKKLKKVLSSYPRTIGFIPTFFPWHEFEEYTDPVPDEKWFRGSLTPYEKEIRSKYKLSLGQLQFRRRKIEELSRDERGIPPEELFKQEYPFTDTEAFLVTGQTYFSQHALNDMKPEKLIFRGTIDDEMKGMITGKARDLTYDEWREKHLDQNGRVKLPAHQDPYGPLKIYEHPKPGEQYAVAGDVALGERENSDYSCLQVINKRNGQQAAVWWGKTHPETFAKYGIQLAAYYNEAILAFENNSFGVNCIRVLQNALYPYPYIKNAHSYKEITEAPTEEWGWNTNAATKPMVVAEAARYVRERAVNINDEGTLDELRIFRQEGAKLGAPQGKHDDRVMALAIALWVTTEHPFQPGMRDDAYPLADEKTLQMSAEIIPEEDDYEEDYNWSYS